MKISTAFECLLVVGLGLASTTGCSGSPNESVSDESAALGGGHTPSPSPLPGPISVLSKSAVLGTWDTTWTTTSSKPECAGTKISYYALDATLSMPDGESCSSCGTATVPGGTSGGPWDYIGYLKSRSTTQADGEFYQGEPVEYLKYKSGAGTGKVVYEGYDLWRYGARAAWNAVTVTVTSTELTADDGLSDTAGCVVAGKTTFTGHAAVTKDLGTSSFKLAGHNWVPTAATDSCDDQKIFFSRVGPGLTIADAIDTTVNGTYQVVGINTKLTNADYLKGINPADFEFYLKDATASDASTETYSGILFDSTHARGALTWTDVTLTLNTSASPMTFTLSDNYASCGTTYVAAD